MTQPDEEERVRRLAFLLEKVALYHSDSASWMDLAAWIGTALPEGWWTPERVARLAAVFYDTPICLPNGGYVHVFESHRPDSGVG